MFGLIQEQERLRIEEEKRIAEERIREEKQREEEKLKAAQLVRELVEKAKNLDINRKTEKEGKFF